MKNRNLVTAFATALLVGGFVYGEAVTSYAATSDAIESVTDPSPYRTPRPEKNLADIVKGVVEIFAMKAQNRERSKELAYNLKSAESIVRADRTTEPVIIAQPSIVLPSIGK